MPEPDLSLDFDYAALQSALSNVETENDLFRAIVNAPFSYPLQTVRLYLGIIVLLQVDPVAGTINRIALSDTDLAKNTTEVSEIPFHEIKIALDNTGNIIAKAIRSGKPQHTSDWNYLFTPAMDAEAARINQASAGIASSTVYPLKARNGGALIFSYFQYPQYLDSSHDTFMLRYSKLVNSALEK